MIRKSILIPAACAAAAAVALPIAAGDAQVSIGDQMISTQALESNGRVAASQHDIATTVALAAGAPRGKYRTRIATGELAGTWTLNFVKKGSYTVDAPSPGLTRGKNTFSGTTMTFNHERSASGKNCGDVPGKYRFTITGKTLRLKLVSDRCQPRRVVFSHKLTKIA